MVKRTGPTNIQMKGMIELLRKASIENKSMVWKRVASDLEKPSRQRRIVNIYKLDKYTKDNEMIIVPGKVLGTGSLGHKVNVAAWAFSGEAKDKIMKAKGNCMSIMDIMQKNPKGQNIRIMG